MNIALGAFIIFLLLTPSLSFKFAISSNATLKVLTSTNSVTDSFWLLGIVPIIVNLLIVSTIWLLGYVVKYDLVLSLIRDKSDLVLPINLLFHYDLIYFLVYIIFANLISFILGKVVIIVSRDKNGNIRFWFSNFFGVDNDWYKLFEGDVFDNTGEGGLRNKIDFITLDILTKNGNTPILYSGIFINYYLKDGSKQLEHVVLQNPYKRFILTKPESTNYNHVKFSDPEPIPGDYFIIPYSEIQNFNINYYTLEDFEDIDQIDDIEPIE